MDLYRKSFIDGQHHHPLGILSYDFIVLAGAECTKGRFYEMEYMIDKEGAVFRALLQVVNPVTDIPIILGALDRNNLLPIGFIPQKAWLTDYDAILIGHCRRDQETYDPVFSGGYSKPKDEEDKRSIKDYINGVGCDCDPFITEACLEYYRGDVREIWAKSSDIYDPVFVCGSENVNDPCFADQKNADMDELKDLLNDALSIIEDYNLPYFIMADKSICCNVSQADMEKIIKMIYNK